MSVKISVILPVYNVEAYLEACLDSLVEQTLKEIEIICVNDGSPDNSLQILESYAKRDDRIKVFTQQNQGQGVARNRGLEASSGAYVYFMDSDDYLYTPDALEQMYDHMQKDQLEILSFNFRRVGLVESDDICNIKSDVIMDGRHYIQEEGVFVMPWLRLIKKALLVEHDIKFMANVKAEDAELFPRLCHVTQRVKHVTDIFIAWRQIEGSCTRSTFSMEKFDGLLATVATYLKLSAIEADTQVSNFYHKRGLLELFLLYKRANVLEQRSLLKEKYMALFHELGMSKLEMALLLNELKFVEHVEVNENHKMSRVALYYVRRFRIFYFKYLRKYGKQ